MRALRRPPRLAMVSALVAMVLSACASGATPSVGPSPIAPTMTTPSSQTSLQANPTPSDAATSSLILPNNAYGYRLRYPSAYTVVFLNNRSLCLTLSDTAGGCEVASAWLDVRDADAHTLSEVADELASSANPSIPVSRTETKIGDDDAILLDNIYAYDVLRQLVILHASQFYVFTFPGWQEGSEGFPRLQALYSSLTGSLTFFDRP